MLLCARTASDVTSSIKALQEQFSTNVHGIACDIYTNEGRDILVQKAAALFGNEIYGLINNVGKNICKPLQEQTSDEYQSIRKTNVDSIYFLCQSFQSLLKQGAISSQINSTVVNVASAAGVQSSGTGAAYGMSKASIIHLTKILACEWASYRIRVNAIAPWMTMTPMLEDAIAKDPSQLDKVMIGLP